MKNLKSFFVGSLLLSSFTLFAQQQYFVYLQTESMTAFYVRIGSQHLSSTAGGYLIIPKLHDTVMNVQLGLAGSSEVQDYVLTVNGDDKGYIVKNFGAKGWGLEDLVTHDLQWSHELSAKQEAIKAGIKPAAPKPVPAATPKPVEEMPRIKEETKQAAEEMVTEEKKPAPSKQVTGTVTLTPEKKTTDSSREKRAGKPSQQPSDNMRFLDMDEKESRPKDTVVTNTNIERQPVVNMEEATTDKALGEREPCTSLLSRNEFEALQLAAATYPEQPAAYLASLLKTLKQKCINTTQLGSLLGTLPSDAARLQVVRTAWPHTLDYFNFKNLRSSLLTDSGKADFDKLVE